MKDMRNAMTHGTKTGNAIGRPRKIFNRDEVVRLRETGLSIEKMLELWFESFKRSATYRQCSRPIPADREEEQHKQVCCACSRHRLYLLAAALASAITAQLVAAAEIDWSGPCGKSLSK